MTIKGAMLVIEDIAQLVAKEGGLPYPASRSAGEVYPSNFFASLASPGGIETEVALERIGEAHAFGDVDE